MIVWGISIRIVRYLCVFGCEGTSEAHGFGRGSLIHVNHVHSHELPVGGDRNF